MINLKVFCQLSFCFSFFLRCETTKYIPIISEEYTYCADSGYIDIRGLELIALNDTHTFLNGTVKINKAIHTPWMVLITSERFDRGKWHIGEINRRIADFCLDLQDPMEPWYIITSKMKHNSCPIPAGSEEVFDMLPLVGFNIQIPPNFQGKWKVKIDLVFKDLPGSMKEEECIEVKFDIMEA